MEFQEPGQNSRLVPLTCQEAGQAGGGCQGPGRRAGPRGTGRLALAEAAGARAALREWMSTQSSAAGPILFPGRAGVPGAWAKF